MIRRDESDIAALDIHYLDNGTVQATLIAFQGLLEESDISELLVHVDEVLLPEVSLDDKKLVFSVVIGRALGSFEAVQDPPVQES